ncbi:MAG: hypothetical protein M3P98_00315 [bacterium]|nr:hypothetical protein [bacterium]
MPEDSSLPPQQPKPTDDPTKPAESMTPIDSAPGEPSDDLPETMQMDAGSKPVMPKKERNSKKTMMIVVIVMLLLVSAVAAWYFLIRDDATPVNQTPEVTETPSGKPQNVAYAFRDVETVPFTLFIKPFAGGDKSQAQILEDRDATPVKANVNGQNVAFTNSNDVYVSTDSGGSYEVAYKGEKNTDIISSIDIGTSGKKIFIAVSDLSSGEGFSQGLIYDIDTKETSKSLEINDNFTNVKYNDEINKVAYHTGCIECDGPRTSFTIADTENGEKNVVLDSDEMVNKFSYNAMVVNEQMDALVYVEGVVDTTTEGVGTSLIAPYEIKSLSIGNGEISTLATVGEAGEKNDNGTTLYRQFVLGFTNDDATPWYAEGNQIVALRDSNPVIYETTDPIYQVFYANVDTIIASTGTFDNFALGSFNRGTKEVASILEGDAETIIFGVTTN